jgi:acetoin utilization deacetylase AcuC-like enzyme
MSADARGVLVCRAMTGLLADPVSKRHNLGPHHPESPERFDAALRGTAGQKLSPVASREATFDEVALCHTREYIHLAEREISAGARELSTGDTNVCPQSLEVALRAVGGVLNAVDMVVSRELQNAFCIVRPPGHHATPARGMGFCVFNNIAIGARYAQQRHGVGRVLIADWDVHHGNGTQDIFYSDGSVFFCSTHQSPWYPGTGHAEERGDGAGEGATLNFPLPAGSGRAEILGAFRDKLAPAMEQFKPELVMISAGFDSRVGDPLGGFTLTDADFVDLTGVLMEIADKYAGGQVVSVLEGGYRLAGLEMAVKAHVEALWL